MGPHQIIRPSLGFEPTTFTILAKEKLPLAETIDLRVIIWIEGPVLAKDNVD